MRPLDQSSQTREKQRRIVPSTTPRSPNMTKSGTPLITENHTERKTKGRPRIQTRQDVSPNVCLSQLSKMHRNADQEAKKRRTQLRLAQRAYRSRKEDELRTLKTRVHELEMLVERINKTFISFTDDLMKSGVLLTYPDVARKLHQTIEQSLSLANKAISVVEDDADASSAETHVPETKASADVVASSMEQVVASANDIFNIADILLPKIPGFAAGGQRNDSSQNPVQDPVQTTSQRSNLVVPKIPTEATLLPSTLPLLHTPSSSMYSLEGATFAHRLYRACAEQGYHCLRNPSSQLEVLTYKFRLPLKLFTRHNIMAYFEEYLSHRHHRKFTEVNIPFMSIGGAGTHFKHNHRSYIIDNASFQPNTIQVGIEQVDPDMRGDWFDCYDVEGYLEKCRIVPIRRRALAERLTFPAALPGLEYGLRNHRISGPNTFQQFGNQKIIDETILIELLKRSSVCLGRAPGFARATVESSVMEYATDCLC